MFILIERYINNMDIFDLQNLAISKGIDLSKEELDFSFNFIKKNWKNVLSNYNSFDLDKYKDKFSEDNFIKIKALVRDAYLKYGHYLK